MKFSIKLDREGESTSATINFELINQSIVDPNEAFALLRKAITNWVKNSESGKDVWEKSGEDFNVGDLSMHDENPDLALELIKVGIVNFSVHANEFDRVKATYDTILPLRDELGDI